MEDDERRPQSLSGEYAWLGPYLTRNTRGRYIHIFPEAIVMLTPYGIALNHPQYRAIQYWLTLVRRLL